MLKKILLISLITVSYSHSAEPEKPRWQLSYLSKCLKKGHSKETLCDLLPFLTFGPAIPVALHCAAEFAGQGRGLAFFGDALMAGYYLAKVAYDGHRILKHQYHIRTSPRWRQMYTDQLVYAAQRNEIAGVKKALARGNVDVNGMSSLNNELALYSCMWNSNFEIADLLYQHGAKVTIPRQNGLTLLHAFSTAYDKGKDPMGLRQAWLIARGADVFAIADADKDTPLHYACMGGYGPQVIKHFFRPGALTIKNAEEVTPFLAAVASTEKNTDTVAYFVARGANVNEEYLSKKTALMRAVILEKIKLVRYLLYEGADKTKKDLYKKTALDYATNDDIRLLLQTSQRLLLDRNLRKSLMNTFYEKKSVFKEVARRQLGKISKK